MLFTIVLFLFLFLALFLLFVIFSAFLGFLLTRVPFVPTYASDVEFFVKELKISSGNVFYDLGSGNGKVVFLVNQMTGARCVGYELTWWTHFLAKIKRWWLQFPSPFHGEGLRERLIKIEFRNQNFFKHSWREANYIYGYLYPPLMGRVEEKFLADCKPGSVAIIRDFPFPNLKPIDIYRMPKKHEIYLYRR